MARLRKRKVKGGYQWYVDYQYEGRRYVQSTKTSDLNTAKRILQDIQGRIARGIFKLEDYDQKHVRLSDFLEEYFAYAASLKKPHTIINERNYAKKFMAFVGNVNLRSLDTRALDKWRVHLSSKVSATTFNLERRTLQSALQVAVKWKYLEVNPFKGVEKAKTEEKRLFMEDSELQKIFNLIDQDIKTLRVIKHKSFLRKFRLLLTFLLNTGLRRNEALNLAPESIDQNHRLIHIVHTKNGRMRTVPLNTTALQVLDQLDDGLFTRMNQEHVSRKFAHYVRKAGLKDFKLHSLRHSFATNLVSAGIDIYTVSRLLGHSDIRTSMIYAKSRMETLREAVRKLDARVSDCDKTVTQLDPDQIQP